MNRSARLNRCAEDVRIHALVIAKLELVDVEMEVFLADLMERTDDSALHDGPEPFDGVGMDRAADIFSGSVMHQSMRTCVVEETIPPMIVRRNQADFVRDRFINKSVQGCGIRALNDASYHVPLALDGSDHDELSRSARAAEVSASALAFVFVFSFPADIGFIHFDITDQFLKFDVAKRHADFVTHEPCGFVGTESHVATDLKRADALLASQHQVNDAEPFTERLVGVLEDRPDQDGEAIADAPGRALVALPVVVLRMGMDIVIGAARTARAFGPSVLHQIFRAGRVIWEQALKIANRHLMNVQGVFGFLPHGLVSLQCGASMPC